MTNDYVTNDDMTTRLTGQPADSFNFHNILYRKADRVATVTFNRPDVLNCVNYDMLLELSAAFHDAPPEALRRGEGRLGKLGRPEGECRHAG